MPFDIECSIDFNLHDDLGSVRAFLERLAPVFTSDNHASLHINLARCPYIGPDAAAILLAVTLGARRRKQAIRVDLPHGPPKISAFCEFAGLNHWVHGTPAPNIDHPQNVTVPLTVFDHASFRGTNPIVSLVSRHMGISVESEDSLRICVNEVMQNVEDHAHSVIGGILCARFMEASRQVRVAIVDRGVGIASSLRSRFPEVADAQAALRLVVVGDHSAMSRINNRGHGISNLWNAVRRLEGTIFIVSEDGFAETRPGTPVRFGDATAPLPGTGVFFTLPVTPEP